MTNDKLILTRTLGFEIECILNDDEVEIEHTHTGYDGSISARGDGYGVEVKTDPINNLNIVESVFSALGTHDMSVNDSCGLHIHVDASDFSVEDKAKLLRFGAGIELLMYALVCPTRRYGSSYREGNLNGTNGYTERLNKGFRKMFRSSYIEQPIPFERFSSLHELTNYIGNRTGDHVWNGRYQWLNANVDAYPTVEFRIYSATTDYEQAQKFGMLSYHIVETVKNSSIKQLQFIIKSIYQSDSVEQMYGRLFDAIGLDEEFRWGTMNPTLAQYIHDKHCVVADEAQEQAV